MRYVKFLVLVLLALTAFKVAYSLMGEGGSNEQSRDGLVVEPALVNLGTVDLNKTTGFSVSIRNNGRKPIKVVKIERSCGCISVFLPKDTCLPGEIISADGTFVTNKLGRFRYIVKLIEEDNSAPEHVIEVVGKAENSSGASPQSGSSNP